MSDDIGTQPEQNYLDIENFPELIEAIKRLGNLSDEEALMRAFNFLTVAHPQIKGLIKQFKDKK